MSTLPPTSPSAAPSNPSWIELSKFIQAQNEAGRAVIDRWFTLATGVLEVLVVAISVGLGLFGWKTLADARNTAEQVARAKATEVATSEAKKVARQVADKAASTAATEQVKLIMQDPHVQKLVRDTAAQLFREGAYKRTVEEAVHEQMQAAIADGVVGNYVASVKWNTESELGNNEKATQQIEQLITISGSKSRRLRLSPILNNNCLR